MAGSWHCKGKKRPLMLAGMVGRGKIGDLVRGRPSLVLVRGGVINRGGRDFRRGGGGSPAVSGKVGIGR